MTARARRRIHLCIAVIAFGPGGLITVLWPRSLVWITFMSWFAFVYAPLSAWAAETPVEEET